MRNNPSNKKTDIENRLRKIRMLIMDVDGVLTEGGIVLGIENQEYKIFNVQDGMGITLARMGGLKVGIITGRNSESVKRRAQELHFDACYQGAADKMVAYGDLLSKYDFQDEHICYMGDDLLDITMMQRVGVAVSPANGRDEVQTISDIVTLTSGGRGAVRELVEIILKAQNKWDELIKQFYLKS